MAQAPLTLVQHLSFEKLDERYRTCKNAREKVHWHLLWLMMNPRKQLLVTEAAKTVGLCERWARMLVHRYNEDGPEHYGDRRKNNTGQFPILSGEQQKELKKIVLSEKPKDGGIWTSPKVALWIEEKVHRKISSVGAWRWLKKLGCTLLVPRPSHIHSATEEERIRFKKSLSRSEKDCKEISKQNP